MKSFRLLLWSEVVEEGWEPSSAKINGVWMWDGKASLNSLYCATNRLKLSHSLVNMT